jgi:hypothetical protein
MYQAYPISSSEVDGKIVKTPVHRLVDLGYEAVPQLIEALDDHGFTRSMEPRFNGYALPRALRVSDFAQRILQHISGRYFFAERTPDGTLTKGTVRQQAEAWWAEVQSKGEKQVLLEQAAAGGQSATEAVRKLVEKYPEAATGAIRAALPVASNSLVRGELVSLAAGLEGDEALEFLRSMLAAGVEVPSQVAAAEILFERGHPEAVPAMISVWRNIQPRLPNNENDAWDEVGGVIEFLAKSEDPAAIDALAADLRRTPVDVRLAAVMVYLPWPRAAGQSSEGKGVSARGDIKDLPGGSAGSAIERLLIAALDDKDQRLNLRGDYDEVSYKDPRICDMAALVLAKRWPEKYPFTWSATDMERDAQIALMKSR